MRDLHVSGALPDLFLERYRLGELSVEDMRRVEARLETDAPLRARLDALRTSDADLLKAHPPEALANTLQSRLRRERVEAEARKARESMETSARTRRFGLSPAWVNVSLGVLVIGLVSFPVWKTSQVGSVAGTETIGIVPEAQPSSPSSPAAPTGADAGSGQPVPPQGAPSTPPPSSSPATAQLPPDDGTRFKGLEKGLEPGLALFRRTPQGAEPLLPGATVRAGDVLRVSYRPGGFAYGAIFSVDGNGSVTRHWPVKGETAGALERGETLLPGAFELDAAPDYERFYLIVSERTFDLNPVLESLHLQKPPANRNLRMVRFDLLKENGI